MPEPDRDKTDLGYGLSLVSLISPSPPHGRDTRGCRHSHLYGRGRKARRKHRRTHPSRRSFGTARRIRDGIPEATWAQPLGPGRAVL